MRRSRIALLLVSCAVVLLLAGGGLALRVGAAEGAYREVILFSQVLALILDNYVDPVDPEGLLEGAFERMLGSLDPHGAYLTPAEVREWKEGAAAGAADPGISVVKVHGSFQVVYVAPGSPAEEAGIAPGDQIRRIDGRPVRDLSLDQVLRLLDGEPGTSLTLDLLQPRKGFRRATLEVGLAPRSFEAYELRIEEGIAVLEVRDLERVSPVDLLEEMESVRSRGIDMLMLDLRNVSGGGPREAVPLLELFATGPLLRLKDRSGRLLETLDAGRPEVAWAGTLAVLVNGATAGGGEAVAGLLRSKRAAKIYGEKTYGLGTEPRLFELPDGSGLLFSAGLWETASGETWNGDGIEPDLIVRGEGSGDEAYADQLRRALEAFAEEPSGAAAEEKAA